MFCFGVSVSFHCPVFCLTSPCQCPTTIMLTPATPRHDLTVTSAGTGLPHALNTSPAAKAARSHVQNWYTQNALPARFIKNAESWLSGRSPGSRLGSHPCNLMASTPSKGRSRPTSQRMPEGTNVGKQRGGACVLPSQRCVHRDDHWLLVGHVVPASRQQQEVARSCRQAVKPRVGRELGRNMLANLWRGISPGLLVLLEPDVFPLQETERASPGKGLPRPISQHEQWVAIAQEERIQWHRAGAAANTLEDVVGAPLSSCFVKAKHSCHVGVEASQRANPCPVQKTLQIRCQNPNNARLPPRRHSWSGPYAGPCLAERQHSLKISCGTYAQTSQRGASIHGKSHRWCEWPPPPR